MVPRPFDQSSLRRSGISGQEAFNQRKLLRRVQRRRVAASLDLDHHRERSARAHLLRGVWQQQIRVRAAQAKEELSARAASASDAVASAAEAAVDAVRPRGFLPER